MVAHGEGLEKSKVIFNHLFWFYETLFACFTHLLTHWERLEERHLASLILCSCFRKPCQPVPPVDPWGEAGGKKAGLSKPLLLFQETLSACSTC
jgi:hypothetical protein